MWTRNTLLFSGDFAVDWNLKRQGLSQNGWKYVPSFLGFEGIFGATVKTKQEKLLLSRENEKGIVTGKSSYQIPFYWDVNEAYGRIKRDEEET